MAEALWHFNASLMSVIYPSLNIFSSLQGTVTRELSLMSQPTQVSLSEFHLVWRAESPGQVSPDSTQTGWRRASDRRGRGCAAARELAQGTGLDRSITGTVLGAALPCADLLPGEWGEGSGQVGSPHPHRLLGTSANKTLLVGRAHRRREALRSLPCTPKRLALRHSEPAACPNATSELQVFLLLSSMCPPKLLPTSRHFW